MAFWARRARRLLPASLLVLAACAAATLAVVPQTNWEQFFTELRASTTYVENWHLAAAAVDYAAADDGPSPVQHFWSLSAEEQFYAAWPLMLVAAARSRRAVAAVITTITFVSLAYSITHTAANPADAYFVTTTRAWEFGAGGMLAMAAPMNGSRRWMRTAMAWGGFAAIATAALGYGAGTPFPGVAALMPVLGAIAVIAAQRPTRPLSARPLQFLGDHSYGIYLWHWPLLVLAPFATPHGASTTTRIVLVMLTLIAALLTKRFVEDPIRRGSFLTRRRARCTFSLAGAGAAVLLAVSAAGTTHVQASVRDAERVAASVLAAPPSCFGAAALDPAHQPCRNPRLRLSVVPTPLAARNQPNAPCTAIEHEGLLQVCRFGVAPAVSERRIALVGDSHASHWRAALTVVAKERRWAGVSLAHSSCPLSTAKRATPEPDSSHCDRWRVEVFGWFRRHPEVDTVFVSELSGGTGVLVHAGQDQFAAAVAGYLGAWRRLPASVRHLVVIRDTPKMHGDTDDCVQRALERRRRAGVVCAVSRRTALDPDPAAVAAARDRSGRVAVADLTRYFCDGQRCYPVIGGALVHKDSTHITAVYATTLGPYLGRRVDRLLGAPA